MCNDPICFVAKLKHKEKYWSQTMAHCKYEIAKMYKSRSEMTIINILLNNEEGLW